MSDANVFRLSKHYKRTLVIDDGDGVELSVPVFVRRFSKDELQNFEAGWTALQHPSHEIAIARKSDGDEQEREDITLAGETIKIFKISNVEVRRRRLAEMSPEQLGVFQAADAKHVRDLGNFCADAIKAHVWVRPDASVFVVDDADQEKPIKTGDDLLSLVGGNSAMLTDLAAVIWNENTMSAAQKKAWRSQRDSTPSSQEQPAPGKTPDATAASVESGGSAAIGAATVSPETNPSGSTETSS